MAQSASDSLLTSVQAGRAIAAILVAFYHTGALICALDKYWGYDPARHFFDFGRAGVEFFFVLSGFIIYYIHEKDLGRPGRIPRYGLKRFMRIYPIYWVILAPVVCVYFLVPSFGLSYQRDPGTILSSLLLVHVNGNSDTELAAAWTLYHEILFYSVFSLCILHKKLGLVLLGLWLCASASTLAATPASYMLEFFFSPLHLLFGMGMLSSWLVKHAAIPAPRPVMLLGLLVFLAAGMEENYIQWTPEMPRNLIYGVGSAMILTGCVEMERRGMLRIPRLLLLTGNASYVIYLINFTVLSLMAKIFISLGAKEALPGLLSYALLVVLSVAAGILVHLWVEKPMMRRLRAMFLYRTGSATGGSAAACAAVPGEDSVKKAA